MIMANQKANVSMCEMSKYKKQSDHTVPFPDNLQISINLIQTDQLSPLNAINPKRYVGAFDMSLNWRT